jgi:hypothetical protein
MGDSYENKFISSKGHDIYDGGGSRDHLDYSLDAELTRVIVYGKSKYIAKDY